MPNDERPADPGRRSFLRGGSALTALSLLPGAVAARPVPTPPPPAAPPSLPPFADVYY